jgi:hypothetical protein
LLYGEEAVIPEEVKLGSLRTDQEPQKEEDTSLAIDTREEDRLQTLSSIENIKLKRESGEIRRSVSKRYPHGTWFSEEKQEAWENWKRSGRVHS